MCVVLREATFRKMSKATKSNWACNKCKFSFKVSSPAITSVPSTTNENYNNLTDSVSFLSDKFDDFGKQLQELLLTVKEMREENRILKKQNVRLNNDVISLVNRVNTLEQKAFDNFIEIIGVPEIKDENCADTTKTILAKLEVNSTVSKAFRVPSKILNNPRKLVAELSTSQCSSNTIINSRKQKPTGNMFSENWGKGPIYVNNYLTFFNRNLLFKTKAFAREASYKFVWFKDSKIFIKKSENHKAILIENESSLTNLTR